MGRGKKHTPEQIVGLLRQIEVGVANGKTTPAAVIAPPHLSLFGQSLLGCGSSVAV
jgi:hypothetical protein